MTCITIASVRSSARCRRWPPRRRLRDAMPGRIIVAGYSVGEMAAWGVGGLLSAADTLDLVGAPGGSHGRGHAAR